MIRILLLLLMFAFNLPLRAQETPAGKTQRIATREGVTVPIYAIWKENAVATVVLFSGGGGGYGAIGPDGWPGSGNFLIRTGKRWAAHPFNVVMVGRPSDGIDLSLGGVREGREHAADNQAIFQTIRRGSALPIWLVGTSMGTISVTAAAIQDDEELLAGIVLSSSITAYKIPGAVPRQDLEKIRVPALVLHHEQDACWACQPHEAKNIEARLNNAPHKKTLWVSGGEEPRGNPCEAFHYHGFIGREAQTVDQIAGWILKPEE